MSQEVETVPTTLGVELSIKAGNYASICSNFLLKIFTCEGI